VNLKTNGSSIAVTEDNKIEYLDLLAQYKLCTRIKEQTDQVNITLKNNFDLILNENWRRNVFII